MKPENIRPIYMFDLSRRGLPASSPFSESVDHDALLVTEQVLIEPHIGNGNHMTNKDNPKGFRRSRFNTLNRAYQSFPCAGSKDPYYHFYNKGMLLLMSAELEHGLSLSKSGTHPNFEHWVTRFRQNQLQLGTTIDTISVEDFFNENQVPDAQMMHLLVDVAAATTGLVPSALDHVYEENKGDGSLPNTTKVSIEDTVDTIKLLDDVADQTVDTSIRDSERRSHPAVFDEVEKRMTQTAQFYKTARDHVRQVVLNPELLGQDNELCRLLRELQTDPEKRACISIALGAKKVAQIRAVTRKALEHRNDPQLGDIYRSIAEEPAKLFKVFKYVDEEHVLQFIKPTTESEDGESGTADEYFWDSLATSTQRAPQEKTGYVSKESLLDYFSDDLDNVDVMLDDNTVRVIVTFNHPDQRLFELTLDQQTREVDWPLMISPDKLGDHPELQARICTLLTAVAHLFNFAPRPQPADPAESETGGNGVTRAAVGYTLPKESVLTLPDERITSDGVRALFTGEAGQLSNGLAAAAARAISRFNGRGTTVRQMYEINGQQVVATHIASLGGNKSLTIHLATDPTNPQRRIIVGLSIQ